MTNQINFLNKKFLLKVNLFLLFVCLLLLIYILVFEIHSPCGQCTSDPFVYGAEILEEQNGVNVIGRVSFQTVGISSVIYFDSNDSWVESPNRQNHYNDNINFSNISIS